MSAGMDELLLLVDIQNDFCEGGALAVPGGDVIVPLVNQLIARFDNYVLTQDWHPADHSSFASQQEGANPFDILELEYGPQTLWPDHCVQGSTGAAFHPGLQVDGADLIIRKGYNRQIDSYSAFFENDRTTPTGLGGYLKERGFTKLLLAGLAFDFCVGFSALDARRLGFQVTVIDDACRSIDLEGSDAAMREELQNAGVVVKNAHQLF